MLRAIFTASVAATILAFSATAAFAAEEINSEKAYTNFTPDTNSGVIVLQVNKKTGEMAILNTGKNITSNAEAEQIAKEGTFVAVNNDKIATQPKNELDNTKVQTGWYILNVGVGISQGTFGAAFGANPITLMLLPIVTTFITRPLTTLDGIQVGLVMLVGADMLLIMVMDLVMAAIEADSLTYRAPKVIMPTVIAEHTAVTDTVTAIAVVTRLHTVIDASSTFS